MLLGSIPVIRDKECLAVTTLATAMATEAHLSNPEKPRTAINRKKHHRRRATAKKEEEL
jgi:hypothetical protein